MEYRYSAIVLKKREVGETDRLYTFYTREAGKIQVTAKGVRKSEAKLASTLETLSLIDLMVVRTRGTGKVAGAVLEQSFPGWRSEYRGLQLVTEALAHVDQVIDFDERDETLFDLLLGFLETGERWITAGKAEKIPLLVEAFFFVFLKHLGYRLEVERSVITGERLQSGERLGLSPSAGGVVGIASLPRVEDVLPVSENVIKLLRLFYSKPFQKFDRLVVNETDLIQLMHFRKLFLHWIRR